MEREFYKGFYLEPIRKQSDRAMFSKVVGWRAFDRACLGCECFSGKSKNEIKKAIREYRKLA
jgi:hypothetical protein